MILWRLAIYVFIVLTVDIAGQVTAYPKGPGCGALLTDAIVGSTIQVTTSFNASFNENHALLNSSNAWCSSILNSGQYLLVSLDKAANLSGFEIQGRSSSNQYLTKFKIRYKAYADASIQGYPTSQNLKSFELAPADGDEIVYFPLNGTKMQTLIFYPSSWNGYICMRLELYGCVRVDGSYTPWSNWTRCSRSCGAGTSVRYRMCSDPAPANGGQDCIGDSLQTKECVGQSCPVDGGFSNWSNWTACSASCGTGFQIRKRTCTSPPPMYGGKLCESNSSTEVRSCLIAACDVKVDGGFSDWSNWTACSASCGTGFQMRKRTCTSPPPMYGGKLCESNSSTEVRSCSITACEVKAGGGDVIARTSDDREDENKYFVPMLILAVALAFFIVIAVAVIGLLRKRSQRNRNNNSIESKSSERMENEYTATTSANLAKA